MAKKTRDGLVSTQIPPDVDDRLEQFSERTGRPKRLMIARVLAWFLKWDDPIRTALIDAADSGMEEVYARLLEHKAAELRAKRQAGDDEELRVIGKLRLDPIESSPPPGPSPTPKKPTKGHEGQNDAEGQRGRPRGPKT